jgi:hypothetical protein
MFKILASPSDNVTVQQELIHFLNDVDDAEQRRCWTRH